MENVLKNVKIVNFPVELFNFSHGTSLTTLKVNNYLGYLLFSWKNYLVIQHILKL